MESELIPETAIKLIESVRDFCSAENVVSVTISNPAEYTGAGELGKKLKAFERQIEEERKAAKAPILEQSRKIDETFNSVKDIVKMRVGSLSAALIDYDRKEEQKRIEQQRAADEVARKERERIEAQARIQREREESAQRAADEARRKAAEATNAVERARLEAEARKRQEQANAAAEKASAKEMIAAQVVAPVIETEAVKVAGVSARQNWKAQVLDKAVFIEWATRTGQLEYVLVDIANLNKYAKMIKDTKEIPGVRVYNDTSTVFRG